MIGYEILAIEKEDGSYLCDKVGMMSLQINFLHRSKDCTVEKLAAEELYDQFGGKDKDKEFILTKEELKKIALAKSCRKEDIGQPYYHEMACDGINIIPITKDRFISIKDL